MPVDYARLARQHGGRVASGGMDYSALAAEFGGRADAPEHRIPAGIDPRVDWDMAFGDEEREAATKGALEAASGYAGMAGLATTSPAAAAVSGAVNAVSGHIPAAILDVGLGAMPGGRLVKLGGKALLARLAHKVGRASQAAKAVEEAAPVVEKAASLSYRPGSAVPMMTEAAPNVLKMPIRLPAESASTVAAKAAESAPAVEKAAETVAKVRPPAKGNVRLPTVYTRPPGTTPMTDAKYLQQSAKRSLAQQQAEAAKAAGMDVGEAFGTATPEVSELESQLRASVMKPQELANELEAKVVSLVGAAGKKKPSAAQLGKELHRWYGIGEKYGTEVADMVLKAHGLGR